MGDAPFTGAKAANGAAAGHGALPHEAGQPPGHGPLPLQAGQPPGHGPLPHEAEQRLRSLVRDIPDFPRQGIVFKDITPLMADADALELAVQGLARRAAALQVDCVLAAEARGFLLGPALALRLGAGFVLARKPGKLPHRTIAAEYALEYGTDTLELHADALAAGARVLIHDDLLATGGTARALCELVQRCGGTVAGCGFLVELAFLNGRRRLAPYEAHSLLRYDS